MLILHITEVQMRIEIDDEAATLRLKQTEIECVRVTREELAFFDREFPIECRDCGECVAGCRCSPGEG